MKKNPPRDPYHNHDQQKGDHEIAHIPFLYPS